MTVSEIPFQQTRPTRHSFIIAAAVHYNGKTYIDWRHDRIIRYLGQTFNSYSTQEAQGFIDQHGNWFDREQSAQIAAAAGQLIGEPGEVLISEEMWSDKGCPYRMPNPCRCAELYPIVLKESQP